MILPNEANRCAYNVGMYAQPGHLMFSDERRVLVTTVRRFIAGAEGPQAAMLHNLRWMLYPSDPRTINTNLWEN